MTTFKKPLIVILCLIVAMIILTLVFGAPGKQEIDEKLLPDELYGISGTITEIGKNYIKIDAIILLNDGNQTVQSRKAIADENTIITKLTFPEIAPEDRDKPIIPTEIEVKLSDLNKGNKVDITTKENIRTLKEFTAERISAID